MPTPLHAAPNGCTHPRHDPLHHLGDPRILSRVFPAPELSGGCQRDNRTGQPEDREPDSCFNARNASAPACCLGRCKTGTCERGACVCHPGWRGFDCTEAVNGSDDHSRTGHTGFLYVYAPPPELGLRSMLRFQCKKNSYDADYHFLRRLLLDQSAHAPRLSDASLFYLPTWAAFSFGNIADRKFGWVAGRLVEWLRRSEEVRVHWTANRSRYVMYWTGDRGACGVPDYGSIKLTHWGLTVPWEQQLAPGAWVANGSATHRCPNDDADARCADTPPCFQRPRDLLMPFYAAWAPQAFDVPPPASWECELFFAGSRTHGPYAPLYSQGVRQAVFEHHENRSRFCVLARAPDALWHRSRFCLAPGGAGFGDRLTRAMRIGCVPAIVQPGVAMPFDDILPYADFSLSFGFDDIPRLHALLGAVGEAEHERLLRGVRRFAAAFNWHDSHGEAYAFARYALCLRAGIDCAGFRPERLEWSGAYP